ncbi:hypothetical protein RHK62_03620 [Thermosynechococcus sp. HY213]|uniref:hypothetical protein n=1 Tax=Thermosynechococcus sp. HY213 TaxID=3074104 RepID=UPI0028591548|nr:hypothetical protein [Thermosynechococcus sp. HY213]MDR7921275.1 hypothetical protein [Thermosynechococcus sp. HY213]
MFEHLRIDRPRKLVAFFDEPVIFHCHHYNLFLQQTIEDPDWIDGVSILQTSAQEIFYSLLANAFNTLGVQTPAERLATAAQIFSFLGFGHLNFEVTEEGGEVELTHSHYAEGWLGKYGEQVSRTKPIDHLAVGYVAAALDATFAALGTYVAEETSCMVVTRQDHCMIHVTKAPVRRSLTPSPQMGKLIDQPAPLPQPETSVDYDAVNEALWGLPLEGDVNGQIRAFNVLLTRMPANYYNRIQYRFLDELQKVDPQLLEVGQALIRESGHVCVFYTFGNIMESLEWETVVGPMLKTDTDWIHGGYAVASSLGWGRWQALEVVGNESCRVAIDGNYETNYFLASYPHTLQPACYFAQGAVPAMMNIVYNGRIQQKPVLDEAFYNRLFQRGGVFQGAEVKAREKGDPWCEFYAQRL